MIDYDSWKLRHHNDDDYCQAFECRKCQEKEQTIDECKEFLEEIVKQVYSSEKLDDSKLEFCLDELCHRFGMRLHGEMVRVIRKQPYAATNYSDF